MREAHNRFPIFGMNRALPADPVTDRRWFDVAAFSYTADMTSSVAEGLLGNPFSKVHDATIQYVS